MKTKNLRLLQDWGDFKAGDLLQIDEKHADELIEAKTAELYDPEAEKKAAADAAKAKADADAATVKLINDTVAATVKQIGKDDKKGIHIPAGEGVTQDAADKDPKRGFKNAGEFYEFVKDAATNPRIVAEKAVTGINEGLDADGGYLIPPEFSDQLITLMTETGQVMSRTRQLPMTSNALSIPVLVETARTVGNRQGGVRGYKVAEGGQATASKPQFGRVNLKLSKQEVYIPVTDEMLSDSPITMGALLPQLAANELGFQCDDAIINGAGNMEPLGVMNAACTVSVDKETGQTAATITTENILKMWARMHARSKSNAVWFINQDATPQLYSMYVGLGMAGITTFMPPGGVSGAPYATLMGRPVIEIEQCATLGTVGDIILADMTQYFVGQKSTGIEAASSIHIRFDYGETVFRFVLRMDGQPGWLSALTPANGTATQSPFVTLATRS